MANVRLTSNTTKDYPCIQCGGPGNIVKEGDNPRLKCLDCGMMYDGNDSKALKERGEIPTEAPKIKEDPPEPDRPSPMQGELIAGPAEHKRLPLITALPRNPSHVILSKNRKEFDFVTEKTFKKKILEWEASGKNYDVFQLMKFEYSVTVDLKK